METFVNSYSDSATPGSNWAYVRYIKEKTSSRTAIRLDAEVLQ